MIVSTMQLEEVHKEMLRDYTMVERKANIQGELFQKEMYRKKLQHEIRTTIYKSKYNNTWTIVFRIFPNYIHTAFYIEANDNSGKVAFLLQFRDNSETIWLVKYNSHFFKRYRERCQPGIVESSQLIKYYFRHNFDTDQAKSQKFEDGTQLLQHVSNEGLGIGWQDEAKKVIHLKTFLPHHMLNKGQQDLISYLKNYNDEDEFTSSISLEHFKRKF